MPIFDPTPVQYSIQILHIIFCCPLSAYDKWWFEQKKSPHFREKYLVLSYLNQIFKFKTLLEASSLEGYFSFEYQIWNDGMTDVHRPPTLTLRSRTGAAKPTLWPTLNPCHFTVPCFIFKTKTFSFSSKQALSNNVFGVKIGRTTTLRRLFKVINFRRSKFVCTLSPCPVFGMCAAGLATHLTTPVCPVARTQTIILQVVCCKLALVGIIPNQILFSFSSDKARRTDSWIRRKNTVQPCRESNPGSCDESVRVRQEFARPWVRFPAGLRCVFSSDPAVSSSIFVGAEREKNLIGQTQNVRYNAVDTQTDQKRAGQRGIARAFALR